MEGIFIVRYLIEKTLVLFLMMVLETLAVRHRRQKHTHIAVYVLERNANSQFYANDESLLWSYNEKSLKMVESIYYDNQPLPPNITE